MNVWMNQNLSDPIFTHLSFSCIAQCIELVDHYAPLFFLKVASVQPGEICKKVNLCPDSAKISSQVQENSCAFCKDTVSALVVKLKDPDTEVSNFKCYMLLWQFTLSILDIGENFLPFQVPHLTFICHKIWQLLHTFHIVANYTFVFGTCVLLLDRKRNCVNGGDVAYRNIMNNQQHFSIL